MAFTIQTSPGFSSRPGWLARLWTNPGPETAPRKPDDSKLGQFQALWELSDGDLAARGLKRQTLAREFLLDGHWG